MGIVVASDPDHDLEWSKQEEVFCSGPNPNETPPTPLPSTPPTKSPTKTPSNSPTDSPTKSLTESPTKECVDKTMEKFTYKGKKKLITCHQVVLKDKCSDWYKGTNEEWIIQKK